MIIKPQLIKKWCVCPYCGAKVVLYDNTANAEGVFIKCKRGCKCEFELVIRNGEQIIKKI